MRKRLKDGFVRFGYSDYAFEQWVKKTCKSEWEGCMCGLYKNHEGLHRCAGVGCDCAWTTEQADEWWEEFKQDL